MRQRTLTEKEVKVLSACESDADLSIDQIASHARVRPHVARYVIDDLLARGIVSRRVYIDSYLLGTLPFHLFFSLPPEQEVHKDEIFDFLGNLPEISFVSELAGSFNVWCEVRASQIFQLETVFYRINGRFGDILRDKEILAMPSHMDLPVIAPRSARIRSRPYESRATDRRVELDRTDYRILDAVSRTWEDSKSSLARKLRLPATTIDYRLKRLRREGIILGRRFYMNFPRLGEQHVVHLVSVKGLSEELRSRFRAFAIQEESVWLLRSFLGRWDFLFETHHANPNGSIEFARRLHKAFPAEIAHRESLPVLSFSKISDCTIPG